MEILEETPPLGIQLPRQLTLAESLETEPLPNDHMHAYLMGHILVTSRIAKLDIDRETAEDMACSVTPQFLENFYESSVKANTKAKPKDRQYGAPQMKVPAETKEPKDQDDELFNILRDPSLLEFIRTKSFAGSRFPKV